jgi:hypothetical protein
MSTRQDYITAVGQFVKGEFPLGEPEKILAISKAVKRYAQDRPLTVSEDKAGDGGFDYALTILASWAEGFSTIKQIEYPVDDDDAYEDENILQEDAWKIYQKPAGKVIRFLEEIPIATETMRITYTALHLCDDTQCTVPATDEEAVQMLAAAEFCQMLAAYFAQNQDSTIAADSVDHKSKSADYAARARTYRKGYFDHLGLKEDQVTAASVTRKQNVKPSWQSDQLTHPRKFR